MKLETLGNGLHLPGVEEVGGVHSSTAFFPPDRVVVGGWGRNMKLKRKAEQRIERRTGGGDLNPSYEKGDWRWGYFKGAEQRGSPSPGRRQHGGAVECRGLHLARGLEALAVHIGGRSSHGEVWRTSQAWTLANGFFCCT